MKITAHVFILEDNEVDIIMSDGGHASIHHNGEHMLTTYYQSRLDLSIDNVDDMLTDLSNGKAYHNDWEGEDELSDEMIKDAIDWLVVGNDIESWETIEHDWDMDELKRIIK